jgi:hypothetical protein
VSSIVVLQDIQLIPVLKFEPFRFAAEYRSSPSGFYEDMPEEWYRYWLESLADSGIIGLTPVERGSWHVPTSEFTDPALLGRVLKLIFQKLSEAEFSIDLECLPLDGGLALRCQSQNVLIEPGCCGDLGNVASWRKVVGYRVAPALDRPSVLVGTVSCAAIDHQQSTRRGGPYGTLGHLPGPTSRRCGRGGGRTRAICWANHLRHAFRLRGRSPSDGSEAGRLGPMKRSVVTTATIPI